MSITTAQSAIVEGFDYRVQRARTQTLREWRIEIEKAEIAGGRSKRVGGDMTAFDKHGRMLFEIWDNDGGNSQ